MTRQEFELTAHAKTVIEEREIQLD